jgi:hypothetical protein
MGADSCMAALPDSTCCENFCTTWRGVRKLLCRQRIGQRRDSTRRRPGSRRMADVLLK